MPLHPDRVTMHYRSLSHSFFTDAASRSPYTVLNDKRIVNDDLRRVVAKFSVLSQKLSGITDDKQDSRCSN